MCLLAWLGVRVDAVCVRGTVRRSCVILGLACFVFLCCVVLCAHQNRSGHTALTAASRFGQYDAVEMLLNRGADVNKETTRGSYVLFSLSHAVLLCLGTPGRHRHKERTRESLCVHIRSFAHATLTCLCHCVAHRTALLEACLFGHMKVIKLLLKRNAVINRKNRYGLTVLDMTRRLDLGEVADYMLRKHELQEAQKAMFIAINTYAPPPPPLCCVVFSPCFSLYLRFWSNHKAVHVHRACHASHARACAMGQRELRRPVVHAAWRRETPRRPCARVEARYQAGPRRQEAFGATSCGLRRCVGEWKVIACSLRCLANARAPVHCATERIEYQAVVVEELLVNMRAEEEKSGETVEHPERLEHGTDIYRAYVSHKLAHNQLTMYRDKLARVKKDLVLAKQGVRLLSSSCVVFPFFLCTPAGFV